MAFRQVFAEPEWWGYYPTSSSQPRLLQSSRSRRALEWLLWTVPPKARKPSCRRPIRTRGDPRRDRPDWFVRLFVRLLAHQRNSSPRYWFCAQLGAGCRPASTLGAFFPSWFENTSACTTDGYLSRSNPANPTSGCLTSSCLTNPPTKPITITLLRAISSAEAFFKADEAKCTLYDLVSIRFLAHPPLCAKTDVGLFAPRNRLPSSRPRMC